MKVREILEKKGNKVISVSPDNTVLYAIRVANENKIGSLVVIEKTDNDENLVGIITERDILLECDKRSHLIEKTKVKEIMTKNIIIGLPDDDIQYLMGIMNQNKIRHLPIMAKDKISGIISIGDIVQTLLEESEYKNRYLTQYIEGG